MVSDMILIAAPDAVAAKLTDILSSAGITPEVVNTGEAALETAAGGSVLLLTTYRLSDMTGVELAQKAGVGCDVLMIVPQEYSGEECPNVIQLRNPISHDGLVQAVRTLQHCRSRMQLLESRVEKLSQTLEERKLLDRAKGRLMEEMHLTEAQAHHYLQKQSMDTGRPLMDVVGEILECARLVS